MKRLSKISIAFFVLLLCPLYWGIFHPGFFVSDDGHWMIIRLSAFYEALASGQFPVRFLPRLNQGFGYPVADFLYPLFLYIGSVIHLFKISFILDIKIILITSMAMSGLGMYLFLSRHFTRFPSFIGGLFYTYLPYHLYDLYVRGSVGEIVALAIVPFIFWAIEIRSLFLGGIFIALIITAHNTLALFFLSSVIVYAIVVKMKPVHIISMILLGLGLSTFFWLPALYDEQFTQFGSITVSNVSSYFVDKVSYQLVGWILPLLLGGVIFLKKSFKEKRLIFFLMLGCISLFFAFSISSIFWENKSLQTFVQFPYRFLSLTLIAESFLVAALIEKLQKKVLPIVILIIIFIFSCWPYLFPKKYDSSPDSFYTTNVGTTTVKNEYMPKWVQQLPTSYAFQKIKTEAKITNSTQKGTRLSFTTQSSRSTSAVISYIFFPGWQAKIDGEIVPIAPTAPDGLIKILIPQGIHAVTIAYAETQLHVFSDAISIVSLFALIGYFIKKKYA